MSIELITAPNLTAIEGLLHGFTTRKGGHSQESFAALNLGFNTGDDDQHVEDNLQTLCLYLGISADQIATCRQTHGSQSIVVESETDLEELSAISADIMLTQDKSRFLMMRTADCFPLLVVDPRQRIISNIHAGWRGTLARVVVSAINIMKADFGCDPSELQVAIGPGISIKHFEVSLGIANLFKEAGLLNSNNFSETEHSAYLDLALINSDQLIESGVMSKHIWNSKLCTYSDPARFYSYRRDGQRTGRMASIIGWKP